MRRTTLEDRLEDNVTTEAALAAWEEVAKKLSQRCRESELMRGIFCAGFGCGGMHACDEQKKLLEG